MDKRDIRIGNWVRDTANYNYEFRAGISAIECANLFSPIPISAKFLKEFKRDELMGNEIFHKDDGSGVVVVENNRTHWRLSIHTMSTKLETKIFYVHELQNFLSDCKIYWDICV